MTHNLATPLAALAACIALSACALDSTHSDKAATPAQKQALAELEQDYNAGHYADVAQTVGLSVDLQSAPPAVHIPAMKLQAFSYCLENKTAQCKRSFDRLLQRYPGFDLEPSERDHPLWGPVFSEARADADKASGNVLTDARGASAPSR